MKQLGLSLTAKPPWMVLLISVSVSIFAAYITDQQAEKTGSARFERQVEKLTFDIFHQLDTYSGLLRAGVGLFYASEEVDRDEWRRFVQTLEVERFYPGIQGIGYARYVRADEKAAFEASIRAEGFDGFAISPDGERPVYTPVTFLEPFTWRNKRAFGYDMFSEPARQQAMTRARDSGDAHISGHVILVQETDQDVQAGFLMYVPVYDRGTDPGATRARRESLQGFVYAPFRMGRLLMAVAKDSMHQLRFQILDEGPDGKLLYHSDSAGERAAGRYHQRAPMDFGGRRWTLVVNSTLAFDDQLQDNSARWVLAAGLLDSLLLFFIVLSLVAHRKSAVRHAERMAEQLLLAEKFRQMADFAPTALITVDAGGQIELSNREAHRLFGEGPEQLTGKPLGRFLPDGNLADAPDGVPQAGACQAADGRQIPVELAQQKIEMEGKPFAVVALADVTERKQQEDLLRRKTADLQQFVYAISHDLKSPLVAITGLADMMGELPSVQADGEAAQLLGRIGANSRQMEQLLKDLLALSKVTNEPLALEFIDMDWLREYVIQMFSDPVTTVGGNLKLHLTGTGFWAHKTLITQLLANLINNAIKYRSPARPLTVEVSVAVADDGSVQLAVADNGLGIAPEWHQKVFNVFTRRATRDTQGSGIGLSICQAVAARHQGRIWVESDVQQGATFHVTLPRLKES